MMSYAGTSRDVADPWYTGDFETTFQERFVGLLVGVGAFVFLAEHAMPGGS